MSKQIYNEALGILKNRVSKLHINHKIGNKDIAKLEILDIAKAIETHVTPIFEQALTELEKAQKQEKLLELYRQLVLDLGIVIEYDTYDDWDGAHDYEFLEINQNSQDALNTYKLIKELENEL